MTRINRRIILLGGGVTAALGNPFLALAHARVEIEMRGTSRGERIWFDPIGLAVAPGTTLRFTNRDPGNSHTATTYHPQIFGRARRIPASAEPWNSDYLLPAESFEITLTVPGIYDYYCIPHEMAAMIGRIVVGTPDSAGWEGPSGDRDDISNEVLAALPTVDAILANGRIGMEDRP
ncbi:plastocyanin precursor [Roseovarius sp. A-2]|uniref:plastocyanin/azurin family copper-binding protein n=1 Tax=Roseovarius sp. A-2 TaxID=1570360 RepID=UPI0009B53C9C|nr:plastocyanin/azurin family copper-binding protein [Roseovarius sp. A-2]GAW35828.1 plastocyanin precursor [Roseovarius sp. A-2]